MNTQEHFCRRNREAQVYNLGESGRRWRWLGGLASLTATLLAGCFLVYQGVDWIWRIALFLPLFSSILLLLQARTRTCVMLAVLGEWELGCGTQRVPDPDLENRLRRRAYLLVCAAVLVSVALTALFAVC
jgi:hypothetical protein